MNRCHPHLRITSKNGFNNQSHPDTEHTHVPPLLRGIGVTKPGNGSVLIPSIISGLLISDANTPGSSVFTRIGISLLSKARSEDEGQLLQSCFRWGVCELVKLVPSYVEGNSRGRTQPTETTAFTCAHMLLTLITLEVPLRAGVRSFDEEGLEGADDEEWSDGIQCEDIHPVLYPSRVRRV